MAPINRRQLISGAIALLGQTHLPYAFANRPWPEPDHSYDGQNREASGVPQGLLQSIFTESLLARSLKPASEWHPYPRANEREAWLGVPQDIREGLIALADQVHGTEWPVLTAGEALEFKHDGNRSHFETKYFNRRQRLISLVLGACAAGDSRYFDSIADGIWLICEESFWGVPAHLGAQDAGVGLPDISEPIVDLFAAETAATLSWITYLIGDGLTTVSPLLVPRIRLEAKRRILHPTLERDFFWMGLKPNRGRLNNWNPWINSNWLTTNLLLEDDPALRLQAVLKICRSLDQFLSDYSPDGACEEGPVYWQRSAGSYFDCCWTLASVTGGAADPLKNPFVKKMGHYIADVHIAGNAYVNYGDAHMEDAPTPELVYRYGEADGDKELQAFGAFHSLSEGLGSNGALLEKALKAGLPSLSRSLPDMLSASAMRSAVKADALLRDSWYPALQLLTARQEEGSSNGFYVAIQAAANSRSHGHNDSGSFIVYHNGQPIFIDVGVEQYTAKTFSPARYSIWTMQSAFHNLPTIGGVMQSEKKPFRASEVQYWSDNTSAGLSMNLATAYPPDAAVEHWLRTMTLERIQHRVRLEERFTLKQNVEVELSFMTQRVPDVSVVGKVLLRPIGPGGQDVALLYDSSQLKAVTETIMLEDKSLQHSWGSRIYRLRLISAGKIATGAWKLEIRTA